MVHEVYISTTPFGEADAIGESLLQESGFIIKRNRIGRKLTAQEVSDQARNATVIIAGTEDLSKLVETSRSLQMIARVGVGLDGVPLKLCKQKNIAVSWTPDAVTLAVAELTIGLMIAAGRFVSQSDRNIRRNLWERPMGKRLGDSTVGIIGFGRIGQHVARLLLPFSPKQIFINDIEEKSHEIDVLRKEGLTIEAVSLGQIVESVDILSLHVPLWYQTAGMIGIEQLAAMPKGSVLVNTSRGSIVNEADLYQVLSEGWLGCAALDVYENEPYEGVFTELDNVILTPHLGACSVDTRARMEKEALDEALRFLQGEELSQRVPKSEYRYSDA